MCLSWCLMFGSPSFLELHSIIHRLTDDKYSRFWSTTQAVHDGLLRSIQFNHNIITARHIFVLFLRLNLLQSTHNFSNAGDKFCYLRANYLFFSFISNHYYPYPLVFLIMFINSTKSFLFLNALKYCSKFHNYLFLMNHSWVLSLSLED